MTAYNLIRFFGSLLRLFALPNPFESLPTVPTIVIFESELILSPELLNLIAEPILHAATFLVVGLYYDRGSAPAVGSFLYTLFYCIHVALLAIVSVFNFSMVAIIVVAIAYFSSHIALQRWQPWYY